MTEPAQAPLPGKNFNDQLRKGAAMIGNLLFAVAKEGVAAYVAQMYACEWNIDDKLRIRKVKQADGKPGFIVFDMNHADQDLRRLDCFGEWQQKPHGNSGFSDNQGEWRDDTEFDTFEEAARLAADVLKYQGGKK